ncbi:hypothetical protein IEU95_15315 [Hoyosella rhizosphaerae]|uniref:Uncharacterized protein n=1 Tax=Hoyosella rhizosphaerae TaxID=1755582 RepID=A0A916XI18_9ACTN|nr:hypothetical protein [Hoyosella rhizosphaerae]MBN4928206.1 hypothetical protein [Hoyosella rhizosphaerae]GGC73216.1 hypothetical protein GCM10011410_27920 [Hoyosella rhizosphaerae]
MADKKNAYVDPGWPVLAEGEHAVTELASDSAGALSPFGETTFPLPADKLHYIHPYTAVNR